MVEGINECLLVTRLMESMHVFSTSYGLKINFVNFDLIWVSQNMNTTHFFSVLNASESASLLLTQLLAP